MAIKEAFQLLSPISVEREINGRQFTFYTCSLRTCAKLSSMIGEIAGHISVLLSNNPDSGRSKVEKDWKEGEQFFQETSLDAETPEMLQMRNRERKAAINGALQALTSRKTMTALGALIMDSLKDEFERGTRNPDDDCLKFAESMDLPTFVEFVRGTLEANAKVIGDLGKGFGQAAQDRLQGILGEALASANQEPESETDG